MRLQLQSRRRRFDKGDLSVLEPAQFMAMLDAEEKQIKRIARLIDDMLDIATINSSKLDLDREQIDLSLLVREAVARFTPQLEASGRKIIVEATLAVFGLWDRSRIEQVITNLLTNAMKYGAGKAVHVSVSASDSEAKLIVIDQGIGIAKSDQERVFLQFERAVSANEVSGLGLGLYIARRFVEAHDGTISVKSELGQGSAFTVLLPLGAPGQYPKALTARTHVTGEQLPGDFTSSVP